MKMRAWVNWTRGCVLAALILVSGTVGEVAASEMPDAEAAAYWNVVTGRAQKIVDKMSIEDAAKRDRVRDLIARQYQSLNTLHEGRDAALRELKAGDSADREVRMEATRREADLAVKELHYYFLGQLAAELSPAQIEEVKDGLTYGVVPMTYKRYTQMLPDLEEQHLRYLYSALIEAREYAMDEGSSEEKHRRFGKYKGRINNYLSQLGIDMKEAERVLNEKEKAARK